MSEAAANLLDALNAALTEGDAHRARRRLGELNAVLVHLPSETLPMVQERLQALTIAAERLRAELRSSVRKHHRQRRHVDAYRRLAREV